MKNDQIQKTPYVQPSLQRLGNVSSLTAGGSIMESEARTMMFGQMRRT